MVVKKLNRNGDYEHNGEHVAGETFTVDVKDKTKEVLSVKKSGKLVSTTKTERVRGY